MCLYIYSRGECAYVCMFACMTLWEFVCTGYHVPVNECGLVSVHIGYTNI